MCSARCFMVADPTMWQVHRDSRNVVVGQMLLSTLYSACRKPNRGAGDNLHTQSCCDYVLQTIPLLVGVAVVAITTAVLAKVFLFGRKRAPVTLKDSSIKYPLKLVDKEVRGCHECLIVSDYFDKSCSSSQFRFHSSVWLLSLCFPLLPVVGFFFPGFFCLCLS